MNTSKTFSHIKVVELASVLAGPMVGRFFAELGAEVIKVENAITGGDVTRKWKNSRESKNLKASSYFASANYGKSYRLLNFTNAQDYETAINLCTTADIIIANFKPGDDIKLGLDFETIKKINPKVIYAEILGFGHANKRTAFDVVLQAETGYLSMSGFKQQPFAKMPVALIDILAAHQLKQGILTAMLQQAKEPKALKVSVSLFDAAIASLANQATNWLNNHYLPEPMGSQHPNIAPYGEVFFTADQQPLILAIGSDKQFIGLCKVLQIEDNEIDLFLTNNQRVLHREALIELISDKIKTLNWATLKQNLLNHNLPFGEIKNLQQVFNSTEAQNLVVSEKIGNEWYKSVVSTIFSISA